MNPTTLSRVGRLGLGAGYGLPAREVERSFDQGVRFYLWGSRRRAGFGRGLRALAARHRDEITIAIQTYTRAASLMEWSVDRALRQLAIDQVDLLGLAWWNEPPAARIVEAARALVEKGKVRHLMVSCHHRPTFERILADETYDAIMVRYSAAYRGAEREVFPLLPAPRPGVIAFTATRWGSLVDRRRTPADLPTPRASDCYRFVLSNPSVDVVLAGPKDASELDEALVALRRGPLDPDELAWMRRVGDHVRSAATKPPSLGALDLVDRAARVFSRCRPPLLGT